jgi:hypothetical protein
MGSGSMISEEIERFVSQVLYVLAAIFGFVVLCVWTIVVLNLAGITNWPKSLSASTALAVFGVSVALLCAMMWFLNRVGILKLGNQTEKNIWRVLIVAVLGSVVAGVKAGLGR